MRHDWDERAIENPRHFIADGCRDWSEDDFYASGRETVRGDILTDLVDIAGEMDPKHMRVLEIGCGAGRVTCALAEVFGEVHAVDVSPAMVELARKATAPHPNATIHLIDGASLAPLNGLTFDFAYSCCVFHHIASYKVIYSLVGEVGRLLRPNALFKFEVQGCTSLKPKAGETWLGVPFSAERAVDLATRCGFEMRYSTGAGQERFWLWYFKPAAPAAR
jgi:SAM-dependent methyltransferase